jgi:uncharacterized iron-regulated protein
MRTQKRIIISSVFTMAMVASTAQAFFGGKNEILTAYADIAIANYTDALNDAKSMQVAIKDFTKNSTTMMMENGIV